jgi:hypothetical protein
MGEKSNFEKQGLHRYYRYYDDKKNMPHDEGEGGLNRSVPIARRKTPYTISAHAVTFRFILEGEPKREPDKTAHMRGWIARYWNFRGCKVQANRKTLFIYVRTGKKASSRQAVYAAWNKADLCRRAFSEWQHVGIKPDETEKPAGATRAHIVVEGSKPLQAALTPYAPIKPEPPMAVRAQLCRDRSDSLKPEFENIEAGEGLDWLILDLKREWAEKTLTDKERWAQVEGVLAMAASERAKLAEVLAEVLRRQLERGT